MKKEIEIGSDEWFRQGAIRSIKRREDGVWDYSSSSLLYTQSGSVSYEKIQTEEAGASYKNTVTVLEKKLIEEIAPKIVETLPRSFDYIDFGPGTEHKEQYFFDAIVSQGKEVVYVPVDISRYMLDIASKYATRQGFRTYPVHQTFENVTSELNGLGGEYRLISLGLTFINYKPEKILGILGQAVGRNGSSFINVHLRDRIDIEDVRKVYEATCQDIVENKIGLLGIDPMNDIEGLEVTDAIEIFCTIRKTNQTLENLGVRRGDRLLIFQSYRYTLEELKSILRKHDVDYYDEGLEFIGCTIRH